MRHISESANELITVYTVPISVANPPKKAAAFLPLTVPHASSCKSALDELLHQSILFIKEKCTVTSLCFLFQPQARVCGHGGEPTGFLLLLWGQLLQREVHTPTRCQRTRWANSKWSWEITALFIYSAFFFIFFILSKHIFRPLVFNMYILQQLFNWAQ